MTTTIFGRKIAMGEIYRGVIRYPVTQLNLLPMKVTQIKSADRDGYQSLQVEFGPRHTRHEITFADGVTLGATINPSDVVAEGSICTVSGTSKGKGFSGVVKRWGFSGGPRTHGQSDRLRAPGSIGQGTTPGRVHKGKKMAGRMGSDTVSRRNVVVLKVDLASNQIWVSGPVPGGRNSLVRLDVTGKEVA